MTINNKKITLIKNSHIDETEMLLNKLLKDADMSQAEFAKKVGKDASTVNRWIKNNRSIAWDNAEKIAEVLGCHPVDIYKPQHHIILNKLCTWDGIISDIEKENQTEIVVPYEYYHKNLSAVMVEAPGTPSDGEIWLFDIPKVKKFSRYAIGKICYLTPSAQKKKQNKNCGPIIGVLKAKGNGRLEIINSYTDKPLNEFCSDIDIKDLDVATPIKAKYDPDLVNFQLKY